MMNRDITKSDLYAILYLLNREIRKPARDIDFSNCFNPDLWPIAIDDMERESVYAGVKSHSYGIDRMVNIANFINCGVMNMKTFEVYVLGEYIRKNHGQFLKRKKNGELFAPKGKGKRKKQVYNPIDVESIGKLDGIEFYKPENLHGQVEALKSESANVVSVLDTDENQKNHLYKLLCDGMIGMHIYLHLWNIHERFSIDIDAVNDEEYKKFLRMVQFLSKEEISLSDVYFHR